MISFDPLWGVPEPICTSMCFRAHEPCLKAQAEQMRLVASSSGVIAVHGQALRPPYAREHANAASASHANAPRACRRWHGCSFFPPQRIAPPQSKSFFGPGSTGFASTIATRAGLRHSACATGGSAQQLRSALCGALVGAEQTLCIC